MAHNPAYVHILCVRQTAPCVKYACCHKVHPLSGKACPYLKKSNLHWLPIFPSFHTLPRVGIEYDWVSLCHSMTYPIYITTELYARGQILGWRWWQSCHRIALPRRSGFSGNESVVLALSAVERDTFLPRSCNNGSAWQWKCCRSALEGFVLRTVDHLSHKFEICEFNHIHFSFFVL